MIQQDKRLDGQVLYMNRDEKGISFPNAQEVCS
jgi:hypothetical protein